MRRARNIALEAPQCKRVEHFDAIRSKIERDDPLPKGIEVRLGAADLQHVLGRTNRANEAYLHAVGRQEHILIGDGDQRRR